MRNANRSSNRSAPEMDRARRIAECNTIVKSAILAAGQKLCVVPTYLLRVDVAYQRQIRNSRWSKVVAIANGWNDSKVGALLVSYRPDDGYFFIIDGQGRYQAALQSGHDYLLCQVITEAALKDEAELFLSQDDNRTMVTMHQKVKAGMVAEHTDCLLLGELMDKYGIKDISEISAIGTALSIVANNPVELDWVLSVIQRTGWGNTRYGYTRSVLRSLHELYNKKFDEMDKIESVLIPIMSANSPDVFRSVASLMYGRNKTQYMSIFALYCALIGDRRSGEYRKIQALQLSVPASVTEKSQ